MITLLPFSFLASVWLLGYLDSVTQWLGTYKHQTATSLHFFHLLNFSSLIVLHSRVIKYHAFWRFQACKQHRSISNVKYLKFETGITWDYTESETALQLNERRKKRKRWFVNVTSLLRGLILFVVSPIFKTSCHKAALYTGHGEQEAPIKWTAVVYSFTLKNIENIYYLTKHVRSGSLLIFCSLFLL